MTPMLLLLLGMLAAACGGRPLEIGGDDGGKGSGTNPDVRVEVPAWPVPGQRNARSLRSEGPSLYWTANEPGYNVIRRCDKRDCGNTQVEVMRIVADTGLMGFEIRGSVIYAVGPNQILICSSSACESPKIIPFDVPPLAVAFDDTHVHWSQRAPAMTFSCPIAGCSQPTTTSSGTVIFELAVDQSRVYGIAADAQFPGPPVAVVSAPKDGSAGLTILAAQQNQAAALAVSGGFVYWSTSYTLGTLARCPVEGCGAGGPEILAANQYYPHFVSPDGDSMFWMNGASAPDPSSSGIGRPIQIRGCRLPACSSSIDVLEEGTGGGFGVRARAVVHSFEAFALPAREMVIDAEAVYWFGDIVNAATSGPAGALTDASVRRTARRP